MKRFDIVIVGSGAGLMVMEAALNKGLSCAIIEKAKFGGTCLTKGCIPSKMLAYPADFIREAEESQQIGIRMPRPEIDWDAISKRMWAQILIHNLFSEENKTEARYDTVPWAIFTHPQVAHVGMTEKEAREKGLSYRTAKNHYSEVVGGRAMGYRDGG